MYMNYLFRVVFPLNIIHFLLIDNKFYYPSYNVKEYYLHILMFIIRLPLNSVIL